MTTPESIKSVFDTYMALQGANIEQCEAFHRDYIEKFGVGATLTNAALMAFEINLQDEAATKLREALVELNKTGMILE